VDVPGNVNSVMFGPVEFGNSSIFTLGNTSTFAIPDFSGGGNGGGNGTAIVNGTSNVSISTADGNVTIGIDGQANVIEVGTGSLRVSGAISNPRTVTGNISVPDDVNALMIGPVVYGNGVSITIPGTSSLDVFDPSSFGGTMTSNITGNGYSITNVASYSGSSVSVSGNVTSSAAFLSHGIGLNATQVTANITFPANYNGLSAGPITVANSVVVNVGTNNWVIV
jgi:hypothetical protein